MSYLLPHLRTGWDVDRTIVLEEKRIVVIRFGRDADAACMRVDEALASIATDVRNFAAIYLVDIDEVTDFNDMYELWDPVCVMFFYRNKHVMVDCGTGNNNKITMHTIPKSDWIDLLEVVYRGARKGHGLVVAPRDYSTKYKY